MWQPPKKETGHIKNTCVAQSRRSQAEFQDGMLMHPAPTRSVRVLSCVLSTGRRHRRRRCSLMSSTCCELLTSHHIQHERQPNAVVSGGGQGAHAGKGKGEKNQNTSSRSHNTGGGSLSEVT